MLVTNGINGKTLSIMNAKDRLIEAQRSLIKLFDAWVQAVKANDLEKASSVVKESNIKRAEIANIEKTLSSKIIKIN